MQKTEAAGAPYHREGLRLRRAPNPSPMTGPGTNSWILGEGAVAVIDPGPALPAHMQALLEALAPGERISHIFVTHAHLDHSPLARPLAKATGAPILAFGDARAGRSARMAALGAGLAGGEGVDHDFRPDITLADGDRVEGDGWALTALHTPGHFGNHLAFQWGDRVFTGDLVLGWTSSLVSPPDGDMNDYMASLARLQALGGRLGHAGHGEDIEDLGARIAALAAHRQAREAQILAALAKAPGRALDLAERIYHDTPPALMAAAARNVLAHLIALADRGLAWAEPSLSAGARFHPV